jgi:mevalonate kinase
MEARASGKVILLGEHAVVYGVPAIAVGMDRGARATATPLERPGASELFLQGLEFAIEDTDQERDLGRAFAAVLDATFGPQRAPMRVTAHTDLPPGAGLGCSAALGVAIARALDPAAPTERILERAMAWERVFHGNPSGIDTAVAAHGGFVYFRRGAPLETLGVRGTLDLCVGHSGTASSTKAMVEAVARLRDRKPEIVEKAFAGIQSLVRNARLALEAGDRVALGRLMDLNQMILAGLFVSTQELEHMCALARETGALGAKLTGAGGGGCVVALVPDAEHGERVLAAWKAAGFEGFRTQTGALTLRATPMAEVSP